MKFLQKLKYTLILTFTLICLLVVAYYLFYGITVGKRITQIIPVNISENGIFCNTKSITAARSAGDSFIISNGGLKYNIIDKNIYNYLKNNIGKTVLVNYEKKAYYHNPCMTSEYIITSINK